MIDVSFTRRWALPLLTLTLLLSGCGQGDQDKDGKHRPTTEAMMGGGMKVEVIHPVVRNVPITTTAAGSLSSSHSINITPQISGLLNAVEARSGEQVEKGQILFRIDPATYQADLTSAQAKLKGDVAQQHYAEEQVRQLKPLVAKDYVTRQTFDQAVATAQAARAQVAQDQAAIRTAKLNLSYTVIRAPIDGRLGEVSLQAGNLVQANSTSLVTLRAIDPLWVNFTLPQSILPKLQHIWPGLGVNNQPGPSLEILSEDASNTLGKGHLSFADNTVSDTSGTIKLQGVVQNPNGRLWPGQFVTVRLTTGTIDNGMVIPAAAVQIGNDNNYVYVVRDGKVAMQAIHQKLTVGTEAVLASDELTSKSQVIFPVPSRLRPDMPVTVKSKTKDASDNSKATEKAGKPQHHTEAGSS